MVGKLMVKQAKARTRQLTRSYHHGNLIDALIAAAVELIEAKGIENLSLRDLSKRIGVSPGAPFRHFKSKADLLTAVAEQSMSCLTDNVESALSRCESDNPLAKLTAIGHGYLDWALGNPTHFQIISSRTLIDFHGSKTLVKQNEDVRRLMLAIVAQGQAAGCIRKDASPHDVVVNARAFAYGLARMAVDGHFPEWRVTGAPRKAAEQALDFYARMLMPAAAGGKSPAIRLQNRSLEAT
jgi:AcrR family transcriptional regulator